MCSFIRTKKSYLDVGGGTTSQLIFKIDGKPVVRTLSETKIKWFQEFGFSVDGVKSSSGSISVPSYTISLTRIGKVTEGEDGQSIPAILKITKVGVSASLSGAWVCGG